MVELAQTLREDTGLFIAGQWQKGEGDTLVTESPTTGSRAVTLSSASSEQVEAAIAAARLAQPAWQARGSVVRGEFLRSVSEAVGARKDQLVELLASEIGKPVAQGAGEVNFAVNTLRFQAGMGRLLAGELLPGENGREELRLRRVPMGVVGAICAWNFPLAMFFRKVAPALLAGNAVVVKPSEYCPQISTYLVELLDSCGLPDGVLNLVQGGAEVGRALVSSPGIDMVTMTGSVASGRKVMQSAAPNLTKVALELGGHAGAIVCGDADLRLAVECLLKSRFQNSGQVCTSAERIYVAAEVFDDFLEAYVAAVKGLSVGDPTGQVDMGPLSNRAQFEKVSAMVKEAEAGGAEDMVRASLSAEIIDSGGFYFAPMVLTGVTPAMRLMQEEVFGPVVPVVSFDEVDEALQAVNAVDQGLTSFLFTNDYRLIGRVENEIQAGTVYVNRAQGSAVHGYHAGHKASGVGGEDGVHGLEEYTQFRSVYVGYGA